ncbi:MAG TPA: sulfotransferase [Fulvivirga sp.]|nr:sulfotransferase [Fulvivirga sp.]
MTYKEIKKEKHIFIYGVNGRSSSTALQRIINSSGEICIWGEAWGIDQPFLDFIEQIEIKKKDFDERLPKEHYDFLKESFITGKHDTFYPNAFNDLSLSIEHIKNAFVEMIKPVNDVKRFGYKEIRVQNPTNLSTLIRLFPNCKIIFLFRDPRKQWISVRDSGWFGFSNNIEMFNSEYTRISRVYQEVYEKHGENCLFIENNILYNEKRVKNLIDILDLKSFDESLINNIISTKSKNVLSNEEELIINNSSLNSYLDLQNLVDNRI